MVSQAKYRATKYGLPFDLTEDDIEIPDRCPVLGEKLRHADNDWSPSVDRLIPHLGYVRGNVRVVSRRANVIKSNATAAELLRVAFWFANETLQGQREQTPSPADLISSLSEFARDARDFPEIFARLDPKGRL